MKTKINKRVGVASGAALVALALVVVPAIAVPGPAPAGTAIAQYDDTNGRISVSIGIINSWKIDSASASLTGSVPLGLPAGGGTLSDSDTTIGEFAFPGLLNAYTDVNLGAVALPGLALDDLLISWIPSLGMQPVSQELIFGPVPPPSTLGADLDGDNDVDGRDFLLIQRGNSSQIPTWESEFGTGVGPLASAQAVPEPSSLLLLLGAGCWIARSRLGRFAG